MGSIVGFRSKSHMYCPELSPVSVANLVKITGQLRDPCRFALPPDLAIFGRNAACRDMTSRDISENLGTPWQHQLDSACAISDGSAINCFQAVDSNVTLLSIDWPIRHFRCGV